MTRLTRSVRSSLSQDRFDHGRVPYRQQGVQLHAFCHFARYEVWTQRPSIPHQALHIRTDLFATQLRQSHLPVEILYRALCSLWDRAFMEQPCPRKLKQISAAPTPVTTGHERFSSFAAAEALPGKWVVLLPVPGVEPPSQSRRIRCCF